MNRSELLRLQKIAQDLDPATSWGSYADKPKKAPIPQANVPKAPTAKQTANFLSDHGGAVMDAALRGIYTSWAPIGHVLGGVADATVVAPISATVRKIQHPQTRWADNYTAHHQGYWDAADNRATETIRSYNRNINKAKKRTPSAYLSETTGDNLSGFADPQSVISTGMGSAASGVWPGIKRAVQELGFSAVDPFINPYWGRAHDDEFQVK